MTYICKEHVIFNKTVTKPFTFLKNVFYQIWTQQTRYLGVLKNFAKFPGKHLCQSLFFNKVRKMHIVTVGHLTHHVSLLPTFEAGGQRRRNQFICVVNYLPDFYIIVTFQKQTFADVLQNSCS